MNGSFEQPFRVAGFCQRPFLCPQGRRKGAVFRPLFILVVCFSSSLAASLAPGDESLDLGPGLAVFELQSSPGKTPPPAFRVR